MIRPLWHPETVYLNTASFGLPPDPVWDALQQAQNDWRHGRVSWEHWTAVTDRARAEFAEWELIAQHHARRTAEIDRSDEIVLSKDLARREVTLEIAQALGVVVRMDALQHRLVVAEHFGELLVRAPGAVAGIAVAAAILVWAGLAAPGGWHPWYAAALSGVAAMKLPPMAKKTLVRRSRIAPIAPTVS